MWVMMPSFRNPAPSASQSEDARRTPAWPAKSRRWSADGRGSASALENVRAKVQTVGQQEQRHQKADPAKKSNLFKIVEVAGRAKRRLRDSVRIIKAVIANSLASEINVAVIAIVARRSRLRSLT